MYLRVTTVKKPNRTYRYAQIVESYRRPDGTPTNRVIASLGSLDDTTIANIKTALTAAKKGHAVIASGSADFAARAEFRVLQNLRYLDVAVLLQLWRDLGVDRLLARLMPSSDAEVPAEEVTTALVLQRCVAPGSKLAAVRWFPTTALPELLGIQASQFNNSRIHRVLADLEDVEDHLREMLPRLVESQEGAYARLFIDATDTWFVGHGPPLASMGKVKEGTFRRRVGLVLLCDQRGYPLRWHTLSGRYHDPTALLDMASEISRLPWVGSCPVVLDRAAGTASAVEQLLASGLQFVTAVPAGEFASSHAPFPWTSIARLRELGASRSLQAVDKAAHDDGIRVIGRGRYAFDLGVFRKTRAHSSPAATRALVAMEVVRILDENEGMSNKDLAELLDCTVRTVQHYKLLQRLGPDIRQRASEGEADGLDINDLRAIASLPTTEQMSAFEEAVLRMPADRPIRAQDKWRKLLPALRVRGEVILDIARAQESCHKDEAAVAEIRELVADINRRLASPRSRRTDASALAEVVKRIKRKNLGAVLAPRMERVDGIRSVALDFDEDALQRRLANHGLNLLIAHPDATVPDGGLHELYFAKDAIEKDFQTIKSVIGLRPVRHHTDEKLRAHVTICVLALLLNRILAARLANHPGSPTADSAIEALAPVHLNRLGKRGATLYTITTLDTHQQSLLSHLGLEHLADDSHTAKVIVPR